jgi:cell division protein FtsL
MKKKSLISLTILLLSFDCITAQPGTMEIMQALEKVNSEFTSLSHRFDILEKKIDDVQWYNKVGDIAVIDKVFHTGPPLAVEKNPTGQGA